MKKPPLKKDIEETPYDLRQLSMELARQGKDTKELNRRIKQLEVLPPRKSTHKLEQEIEQELVQQEEEQLEGFGLTD